MAPPQSLGEGEELVAGRRPVEEAFVARRPARRLLVVPQRRAALEKLVLHATNLRIPIVEVEGGSLTALAGFDGHQGIALVVEPRRYAGLDDILARAATRGEPPFVLVLDSLEDPHNVGSLLRSAEAAGVHGVIFPTHRQAPLSPSAIKASAGAVEHLLLCPVDDLAGALSDLHVRGVRIAGAEGDAPMTARESDLRGPLAIVVGSEGQGLGPAVRRRCDMFMRIPMRGAVGSLNAAVAGSILLFEAVAQRDMERADGSPPAPTEAPAKAKPKRATKATAAVAPPAPAEAPAKAPAAPKPKPKPKRATKATATVAQPAAAEAPAKAKPRRIAKTTASAAPAAPVKPKRAARPKPAANDVPTAPDDGESDLLPD
jgi:23S rRNA (guanosine2251-2'-O)-methyltransferase